ncbi:MAG: translesion DNA synthesis-associated protein ImuA [Pseudomonadota bacterium]
MGNKKPGGPAKRIAAATKKLKTPAGKTGVFFSAESEHGSQTEPLEALLTGTGLWRANTLTQGEGPICSTGYAALDERLPGGGWPVSGLTELLSGHHGVGELRLLMPALATLAAGQPGWIVWIAPPYMPNAPALQQWGLPPERMLVIHPRSSADAAWAAEQALGSGTCIAVMLWTNTLESGQSFAPATRQHQARLSMQQFSRRLQLAAATHRCWAIALRAGAARNQPSAAMLRLYIDIQHGQRNLHVLKVRGGQPATINDFDAGIDVDATMVSAAANVCQVDTHAKP